MKIQLIAAGAIASLALAGCATSPGYGGSYGGGYNNGGYNNGGYNTNTLILAHITAIGMPGYCGQTGAGA